MPQGTRRKIKELKYKIEWKTAKCKWSDQTIHKNKGAKIENRVKTTECKNVQYLSKKGSAVRH